MQGNRTKGRIGILWSMERKEARKVRDMNEGEDEAHVCDDDCAVLSIEI